MQNYIQYNLTISFTIAINCIEKLNNTSWQDVYWQFLYHTHVIVHCLRHYRYTSLVLVLSYLGIYHGCWRREEDGSGRIAGLEYRRIARVEQQWRIVSS